MARYKVIGYSCASCVGFRVRLLDITARVLEVLWGVGVCWLSNPFCGAYFVQVIGGGNRNFIERSVSIRLQ